MTGLEKKSRVRECVAESPFCYRENCLLYIPENLKATLKGSREEAEQLAGRSVIWCVPLTGIHWYCLHLIPDGKCAAAFAGSDPVSDGAGMEKLTGRNRTV